MNFFRSPSVEDVIEQLIEEGYLEPEDQEKAGQVLTSRNLESPAPWFLQLLIGLGAWLAAIFCTVATVWLLGSGDPSPFAALALGLIFCAASVQDFHLDSRSILKGQITLVLAIIGQLLAIAGFAAMTDSAILSLWAAIFLEMILLILHKGMVQRFLSVAIIIAAAHWLILLGDISWGIHILATILAWMTFSFWVRAPFIRDHEFERDIYLPLSYALPLGMFAALLVPLLEIDLRYEHGVRGYLTTAYFDKPLIAAIGLFIIAIWLIREILDRYQRSDQITLVRLLYGATFLITVATLPTPGILAALMVLTIGFWHNDKILIALAIGFLAVFIGVFYYNLQTTLLVKSYIMFTTGGLLLVLWYVIFQRREVIKEK